jgi:hypothetical protein
VKKTRLIHFLKYQCSLTETEARGVLEDRIGEAASHYGGKEKCIFDAIKARRRLYKQFNNSPKDYYFFRLKGV